MKKNRTEACVRNLMVFVLVIASVHSSWSQARRKTQPKSQTNVQAGEIPHYLSVTTSINNITGVCYEIGLRNKYGAVSKSTVSFLAGYSSRYSDFEDPATFQINKKWIHGVGFALVLNNYIYKLNEGFVWNAGVTGNLFFEHSEVDKKFSNQLKTYSVFFLGGYRTKMNDRYFIQPNIGVGIMGSSFKSSTGSEINGLYLTGGITFGFKL
ncbi:hypothetical protein K1X84_05635 [bacterium]|nr:hypothetical protein [bacterium]